MLTKEEREATIERIKSYGDSDLPFYKLLFGSRAPYAMQYTEYLKALKDRILDLCDTSNMIELPIDKDGEVIRVDDTVFNTDGEKLSVTSIRFSAECGCAVICENDDSINVCSGDELTHKKQATIESLVERFRRVLNKSRMSAWSMAELINIADQLESLGDSDD